MKNESAANDEDTRRSSRDVASGSGSRRDDDGGRGWTRDVDDGRGRTRDVDGGWGWMVCLFCFLSHILTGGLFYASGILFTELLSYFQESRSNTAWILSIFEGISLGEGPLSAALVNRLGCRKTAVVGTILVAGGYLTSMFASNISVLYLTIGVVAGCGNGLLYFTAVVCVSQYFDKKRSLATGLGVSGSAIGTFIYGPFITFLIEEYTWRGALLVQSAIMLHGFACALAYRPLASQNHKRIRHPHSAMKMVNNSGRLTRSLHSGNVKMDGRDSEGQIRPIDCIEYEIGELDVVNKTAMLKDEHLCLNVIGARQGNDVDINEEEVDSCLDHVSILDGDAAYKILDKKSRLCSFIDFELLTSFKLDMFVISATISVFGYYVPYVFLPDNARDLGIDPDRTAWLIAAIGVSNTGSRVLFGVLADHSTVNRLLLYNITLIVNGTFMGLIPLCHSFELLLGHAVVFGSLSGAMVCLRSVILADIVGIHRFPDAFGMCNFFTGIMIVVAPPIAGWLADMTGSYTATFVTGGMTLIVGGAVSLFIPCCDSSGQIKNNK